MSAALSPAQPTAEEIASARDLLDALVEAKTAAATLVAKLARYERSLRETVPGLAPSWSVSPLAQEAARRLEAEGALALAEEVMQLRDALAAARAEIAQLSSRPCAEAS